MSYKSYEKGHWAIFKNRGPGSPVGYLIDGIGEPINPEERVFKIRDGALFDVDGTRLGHLAPLEDSWAVNFGDHVGHVLRRIPE
jgi:hypothetical protein